MYLICVAYTEDDTSFTNDLLGIVDDLQVDALSSPSSRDNSLKQSIDYLKNNSGLFSVLYKVSSIWYLDNTVEQRLLEHLYKAYTNDYKPEAYKNKDINYWLNKHKEELSSGKLEDSF